MNIVIEKPKKEDLTDKGFTNKIKIHPSQTKESLMSYGFTNKVKRELYFCRMLGDNISFTIIVDSSTLDVVTIDILVEDFLQPYDYQQMIMSGNPNSFAVKTYHKVNELLNKLQNDGVITGFVEGMYI